MKIARKLLLSGGASLAIAGGTFMLPLAQPAGALSSSLESMKKPLDKVLLHQEANMSFDLKTEVDSGGHVLWATVTNKSSMSVVPDITFNGDDPLYEPTAPLESGKSMTYAYYFTGNDFSVETLVKGEGLETIKSQATVNIQEPVSFKATETNDTVVIGTLRNNSTLVPQTVYTKIGSGEVNVEQLEPGESRTIAMTHSAIDGQVLAGVTIATSTGYESSYAVKLGLVPELPVPLR